MDKVIELAKQAGFTLGAFIWAATDQDIERFYTLARADLEAENAKLKEVLEKLARLGNGDRYGNSDGNMIARAALGEK